MPVLGTLCVALAIGASALLFIGLPGVSKAQAEARWPSASAEILDVQAAEYRYRSEGTRPGERMGTRIIVRYRYEIDGREYTSTRYSTDERYDDWGEGFEQEAAARVAELQAADRLTVYVDPSDPTLAVIRGAELAPAMVVTALGIAAAIASISIAAIAILRRRDPIVPEL